MLSVIILFLMKIFLKVNLIRRADPFFRKLYFVLILNKIKSLFLELCMNGCFFVLFIYIENLITLMSIYTSLTLLYKFIFLGKFVIY